MKKIILALIITLFTTSVGSVLAAQLHFGFTDYNTAEPEIVRQVTIAEGWNLLHGFANPEWIVSGDISARNIKAIFILNAAAELNNLSTCSFNLNIAGPFSVS